MGQCMSTSSLNCIRLNNNTHELQQSDCSIQLFSLDGIVVYSKIVRVYDGDTVHITFFMYNMNGKKCLYRWKCRLYGIDTPEIRTKNKEEKKQGLFVRDYLQKLLLNKCVYIRCYHFDKYGRLLIKIYTDRLNKDDWTINGIHYDNVNDWLIDKHYAKRYFGGKKE